ncbi:PREDICTED: sodium/bile acid cotransporter 4 [Myotis brandtii]|nr:PREDICTED: sodium/bile acid cotransporter 4 [Myotis brandtii]
MPPDTSLYMPHKDPYVKSPGKPSMHQKHVDILEIQGSHRLLRSASSFNSQETDSAINPLGTLAVLCTWDQAKFLRGRVGFAASSSPVLVPGHIPASCELLSPSWEPPAVYGVFPNFGEILVLEATARRLSPAHLLSLLVDGDMNLSIIMTISSTLLALALMPLCLWVYSRAWINTPLVQLLPLGAVTLTLCSTLIPIGLGVFIRYKYNRVADYIVKVSLWSLLVTLVVLFIMTGTMLGPELLASIPATVYMIAIFMPLAGYASGYGLASLFRLPPNCKRTVCLETGSQNVQLCTAILKLAFPPRLIGSMYMFPLLYALFQSAEAGIFVLIYKMYGSEILHKQDPLDEDEDTDISYKKLKEEEMADTSYGSVNAESLMMVETAQTAL